MHRAFFMLFSLFLAAVSVPAQQPQQSTATKNFNGSTWWAHVKVLADDNMEGRETGSEGLRKAEAYVVDQLTRDGLTPAGTKGFYQPVKFVERQILEKTSSAALIHDGKSEPLTLGEDAYFNTRVNQLIVRNQDTNSPASITADLVFVGNGLQIPEKNHDDLAGLDLKKKVVVYIAGSPAEIPGALAAHYGSIAERWKVLHAAGAVGIIVIPNPASMDIPWSRMSLNRAHPTMDLADPEFDEIAGLRIGMTFNPNSAEKLFAGSGHTFAELAVLAKDRKRLPHFPLAVSLNAHPVIQEKTIESSNIVAKLPGSDPTLKDEYVVLSAHIDHVGIGEPVNGDRIYNGAMDDGSGSALLLDMAAHLKSQPKKPRRSILFVFVTAEEKGLLGSKYFAAHPTVSSKSMIADINVDMFLPIVPLKVLRVQGINDSDLGTHASEIAQSFGVKAVPDPEPLRNLFVRSDQYNFIHHGIPVVIMDIFYEPGSPEAQTFKDWLTNRYHAPSDDINQPVDLSAAALYEEIVRQLLLDTANADTHPQWKQDSFFRRYASAGGD